MGPTPYILQIISHFANGKYIASVFVSFVDSVLILSVFSKVWNRKRKTRLNVSQEKHW